jgi:hypothetical protein
VIVQEGDGVQAVVAILDDHKTVSEVVVVYRGKIGDRYPEPINLAHHLVDRGYVAAEPGKGRRLKRQAWSGDGLSYEVVLTPQSALGGVVRVGDAKAPPSVGVLAGDGRDFGAVHLDGSYDQCRVNLGAEADPHQLVVDRRDLVARVRQPVKGQPAYRVTVKRRGALDLPESLTLSWSPELNPATVGILAEPLWAALGSSKIDEDDDGVLLAWENAQTSQLLRLPFDIGQPTEFVVADRQPVEKARERAEAAKAFDQAQRKARFAAHRTLDFLPRWLKVEQLGAQEKQLHLGQTRDKVLALIPARSAEVQRFELEGGAVLSVLFNVKPPEESTYWPQQLFVRFGPNGVNEVRVRYQQTPREGAPTLLGVLRQTCGAPEKLSTPWSRLWTETASNAALALRWRDDRSLLTYQSDGGSAEVALRDWPADQPLDAEPTPLLFCSTGPADCRLGEARDDVLGRTWLKPPKATDDGGYILYPKDPKSRYDTVLVYFEGDKVARVNARSRHRPDGDAFAALREVWARDLGHLGSLRRLEPAAGLQFKGGYGWHDDRVRVRSFVQGGADAPELWTEWRTWPLQAARTEVAGR